MLLLLLVFLLAACARQLASASRKASAIDQTASYVCGAYGDIVAAMPAARWRNICIGDVLEPDDDEEDEAAVDCVAAKDEADDIDGFGFVNMVAAATRSSSVNC